MRVQNKSKRLICLQTTGGRVDLLPNEITEDDRIDSVKNEKVFKSLVEAGDIAEVKTKAKTEPKKKTQKELLIEEAEALDIDTTDMTIDELKEAIAEAGK